jgi:hypothetical protein
LFVLGLSLIRRDSCHRIVVESEEEEEEKGGAVIEIVLSLIGAIW